MNIDLHCVWSRTKIGITHNDEWILCQWNILSGGSHTYEIHR